MQKKTELVKERERATIYSIKMTAIKKAERQKKCSFFYSNCVLIRVKLSLRSLMPKMFEIIKTVSVYILRINAVTPP